MKIQIYYEDTDVGGVVYHSNYLNFCERARSDVFFKNSLTPILKNGHFVARKIIADYFLSAKLGDIIYIKNEIVNIKAASFTLNQIIYKDDKKIFELVITLAYLNFNGKPQRIDKETKELILYLFP